MTKNNVIGTFVELKEIKAQRTFFFYIFNIFFVIHQYEFTQI